MRKVGTVARGVRCPVIRQGDALDKIVVDSVMEAASSEGVSFCDKDIVGITEAVLARAQGNYATVSAIAKDVGTKFQGDTLGIVFPILSRNRFSVCLQGIATAMKKIVVLLSYPADEVGNHLFPAELLETQGVNPWQDVLDEEGYRRHFGFSLHPFTGVDYVSYYRELIEQCGCEAQFIFSSNPKTIVDYTDNVLVCDIHTRHKSRKAVQDAGAKQVLGLEDILTTSVDGSGYTPDYGLLGSNKATDDSVKLFPRDCQPFVDKVQKAFLEQTGKHIEVLIYGDGAFKDPQGKIWELADPVVSPAFTDGLRGTPKEIKLKYLADNQFQALSGEALDNAVRQQIAEKNDDHLDAAASLGTTPRQLTDLIGSLCDLTSGSGDKGTPIVWIQGYFDNFSQ